MALEDTIKRLSDLNAQGKLTPQQSQRLGVAVFKIISKQGTQNITRQPLIGEVKGGKTGLGALLPGEALRPLTNVVQRAKAFTERIPERLAQRGVPPLLAGTLGGIPRVGLEFAPSTPIEAVTQLASGPALKLGGKAARFAGKYIVDDFLPAAINLATGAPREAAKIALKRGPDPFVKALFSPEASSKILENTKQVLIERRQDLGRRIGKIANVVNKRFANNPIVQTDDLVEEATESLAGFQGRLSPQAQGLIADLSSPKTGGKISFKDAFKLKKEIQDRIDFGAADITGQRLLPVGSAEQAALQQILSKLNKKMETVAPVFAKANKAAHELFTTFDEIRDLFLKAKDPQQAALSLLKKGDTKRYLLERIDKKLPQTAKFLNDLEKTLVSQSFKPLTRSVPFTGGAAGLGYLLTRDIPTAAALGLATSPRAARFLTRGAVQGARKLAPAASFLEQLGRRKAARVPAISQIFRSQEE